MSKENENNAIAKRAQEILSSRDLKNIESSSLLSKLKAKDSKNIVLLDLSGSMADFVSEKESKFTIICDLVKKLQDQRMFWFSSNVHELKANDSYLPRPNGGTNMTLAFCAMKQEKAEKVILITDGIPDDQKSALEAAKDLNLEIVYIGPDPVPEFLHLLAKAGNNQVANMNLLKEQNRLTLFSKVKGLLENK
jgi:hypothetical protein